MGYDPPENQTGQTRNRYAVVIQKRNREVKMPWGLFEVILVVAALFSQVAMINHAMAKDKDQSLSAFIYFYNVFRIPEYIEITKKEKGRIGEWFWTFVVSMILLIFVVMMEVITGT